MEENQNPTSPIAGEPASVNDLVLAVSQQYHGLMALRATLHRALWDFANTQDLMAHDLAAAVADAHKQVTAMLGITEPADEDTMFKRPLVESDFFITGNSEGDEEEPYAGDAEGEMRAEAEAERLADARLELVAELASCDWEGWD